MPHPPGRVLRVVLGDQCSRGLASLRDLDPARDVVLLAEVMGECTYVRHHKQKIVLVLSAMRHFARALEARGVRVDYVRLDDPENTGTLAGEVARAAARHAPEGIVCTFPGEWRVLQDMRGWEAATGLPGRDPRRRPLPLRPRRVPPLGAGRRSSCGWNSSTARCAAPPAC